MLKGTLWHRLVTRTSAKGSLPRQHLSVAIGQAPLAPARVYKPVLKESLAPGRENTKVFDDFIHRPMPRYVVVV